MINLEKYCGDSKLTLQQGSSQCGLDQASVLNGEQHTSTVLSEQERTIAPLFAYVGCRTTKERNARGKGINVYRVEPLSGTWTHVQLVEDIVNPSFLTIDHHGSFLYSVHGDCSEVSAFNIDRQSGQLTFINKQSTAGKNPVHLVVDPTNRFLCVANYETGTLAVLPINHDGSLNPLQELIGPFNEPQSHNIFLSSRQGISHPHQIVFDRNGRLILVPDLGLDRILILRLDNATGELVVNQTPGPVTRKGAGPRHVVFDPTNHYVYVANELDSTVTTYSFGADSGELISLQTLSTLPVDLAATDFPRGFGVAEITIAPTGRFVYVSNRGHSSIAIFSVDPVSGRLLPVGWQTTGGKGPRFFTLDPSGEFLYAANELTDNIVPFRVNQKTGELTPTGKIVETGSPVCIIFTGGMNQGR